MSISSELVKNIANLAKFRVSESEIAAFSQKLSSILDLAASLENIDTSMLEPMSHPLDLQQRLRADVVTEIDQHQKFQAIAPLVEADLYLVPKVIE